MSKSKSIVPEVLDPGEETPNLPEVPKGVFNKRLAELEENLVGFSIEFDEACKAVEDEARERIEDVKALRAHVYAERMSFRKRFARRVGINWGK